MASPLLSAASRLFGGGSWVEEKRKNNGKAKRDEQGRLSVSRSLFSASSNCCVEIWQHRGYAACNGPLETGGAQAESSRAARPAADERAAAALRREKSIARCRMSTPTASGIHELGAEARQDAAAASHVEERVPCRSAHDSSA